VKRQINIYLNIFIKTAVEQADLDAEIATVVVAERLQGQGQMDQWKVMRQHVVHAEVNVKFA